MTFGDRLKAARLGAGYTQEDLAVRCGWEPKSGQVRIANYEANSREPTLADIELIADSIGVPAEELAFRSLGLRPDERELIQAWRLCNREGKDAIRAVIKVSRRRPQKHNNQSNNENT